MTDETIPKNEAAARVAAAYEAAVNACSDYPRVAPDYDEWTRYDEQIEHSQACIHALAAADPDGQAALARLLAAAKAEGMREAASQIMAVAKSLPVQHESKERGKCTYNWARWAEGIILAAADKVAVT